ncbi:hypothetical protein [Collinsella aerofaciens]|uniref:hypothetical protein n=1 Tax=Collinsella aerofaciens TaxID=74426 RepID=UPI0018998B13|nr:hypothetical protein [Collinsella aerofaciens]
MSGVYQRNREVSEYKFFTQAIAIRVEVNKLMASSSVVPKAYRLLNAVPTVETARGFTWLKKRIFYTETGRIVVKPCRDSITRERRKLKKMARMVADGVMTPEQVERSYQSWRGGMKRLDAHRSVLAMDALYHSLFENLAREGGGGVLNAGQPEGRFKRRQALAIAENRQLKAAA